MLTGEEKIMKNNLKNSTHKYCLAGIDLDGTLLDGKKNISAANFAAVQQLLSHGITVVLTTGRIYQQTTRYYRELGLKVPVVTSNGASVRIPFRRTLQEVHLQRSVSRDVLQMAKDFKITALSYHRAGIHITSFHDWNDNMDLHRRELGSFVKQGTVAHTGNRDLQKILIFCTDPIRLREFEQAVASQHGILLTVDRNPQTIDYTANGVTKVTGLKAVCELLSIDSSQVLFFGDGMNDVDALQWAGCGIAMHHGMAEARRAAKFIAPETDPAVNLAAAIAMVL
jgi:Cof subfamily protein (haloacid dehalogenase superfamily)